MMRTTFVWTAGALAIGLGLFFGATSSILAAEAPVYELGFEKGFDGFGHNGRVEIVKDVKRGGNASLRIDSGFAFTSAKALLIPATPEHDYRISVWIKTDGVDDNGATLTVVARGGPAKGDNKWLGTWIQGSDPKFVHDKGLSPAIVATGGTHDWQQLSSFIAGGELAAGTQSLMVYFRHDADDKPKGSAWFDDLTVEELPLGTAPKRAGPLVRNGGFEQGKKAWGGKGWTIVSDQAAEGKSSLQLEGGFALQGIPVEGNKRYKLSMKIKSDGADEQGGFVQFSYRGKGLGQWAGPIQIDRGNHNEAGVFVTGGTHDWKTFSAVIAAPKSAEQIFVYLRKEGKGTVWYDDVALTPTDEDVTGPAALRSSGMAPAKPLIDDTDFARPALVNTGFENGLEGWLTRGLATAVEGSAPEASHALELVNGDALQGLKVSQGKRYRLSVKVKTLAASEMGTTVELVFRGHRVKNQALGVMPGVIKGRYRGVFLATGGNQDWHEIAGVFEAPRGYDEVLISLNKNVDDGKAWFDQLSVTPTDAPAMTAELYQQQQLEKELAKPVDAPAAEAALKAIIAKATDATSAQVTLADNGKALYAVHVGSATSAVELQAAKDLADYLGRISGASFEPMSNDAAPSNHPLLVVGRNNKLTAQLCPDIQYDKLGEDGFVIRTVGPHIVITGATDRGTLYGVYWLLDRDLGVRWFSANYTVVPHQTTLVLKKPDTQQVARFRYREIFSMDTDNPWFRQHNLLNGASHHRANLPTPEGLKTWSSYWPEGGHNFQRVVSAKAYAKEHPEYFYGGQLAMMNPAVRDIAANFITKAIEREVKKGRDPSFEFSQEDRGYNPDPAGKMFAAAHGGALSAPLVDMVNDVATRVRKEIPDARLSTLAYQWSFPAPSNMKVDAYVVMTLAPIDANFAKSYGDPANEFFGKNIAQWGAIADNIVIWDYITNFGSYVQPYPNLTSMFASIQWMAQFPTIQGYFAQGSYTSLGAEFADLRAWVAARVLWNPSEDPQALAEEFVKGYYGAAAPQISEYIKLMQESVDKTSSRLSFRTGTTMPYLSFDVMRKADELFDQAEALVADQPGVLRRVRTARIGVDYVIILRRAEYERDAKKVGVNWPIDTAARIARFSEYARAAGVNRMGEGVGDLNALLEAMKINRTVPATPKIAEALKPGDWVDYQDMSLRRFGHTALVQDEKASDHGAIRMPGNVAIWGVQMRLDEVPPQGLWNLYAVVRIDPGQGKPTDRAMTIGVHPGKSVSVPVSELADGNYHVIAIPGGPYRSDAGLGLWFAPPNSNAIEAMYVDRVFAVRAEAPATQPASPKADAPAK